MQEKTDYSALSDFEINYRIAKIVFPESDVVSEHDRMLGDGYQDAAQIIHEIGISGETRDYCNNPSDIMPIMIEHKISLEWEGDIWSASLAYYARQTFDKNPCRAIAICFLKMMEAKA